MTTLTLSRPVTRPIDETYEDVKRLIYKMCNDFIRRNGGDFEELLSAANEVYMDAYRTWAPGAAPFTHYLCICIHRRLIGDWRKARRLPISSLTDDEGGQTPVADQHRDFRLAELTEGLSEAAKYIIQITFNPPEDLDGMIERKGGKMLHYSSTIKEYLRGAGWSRAAIRDAWMEVQELVG